MSWPTATWSSSALMSEDPSSTADTYWKHLSIPSPSRRALIHAGIYDLDAYAGVDQREIAQLHGMGPKALGILSKALSDHRETP
jgi:hypothetical protein